MIPRADVTAWGANAAWPNREQIEQDLLLSRILVEVYNDAFLSEQLMFRGGTCLHKLYLPTARRYSEDLDFVRTEAGPIGPVTRALTDLGTSLGFEVTTRISAQPKVYLRTTAETGARMKIKLEMNTHEHSPALEMASINHAVASPWWTGSADIVTFQAPELVATKIRAIFQRKKGRDLFDLWLALTELALDPDEILAAYPIYAPEGLTARRSVADLRAKVWDPVFRNDLNGLISSWPASYALEAAADLVIDKLLSRIPSR